MRTVSFVDRVDFDIEGNVMSKAFTIGDVDNDGNNEIVIGNTLGDLFIFKNIRDLKPWTKASDLGMIACIGVGDLMNEGCNCLISLSTEGWCHIFHLVPNSAPGPNVSEESDGRFDASELTTDNQFDSTTYPAGHEMLLQQPVINSSNNPTQHPGFNPNHPCQPAHIELKSAYIQKLSSNAKACLIADIDGDGCNELIVSYTDRVVRSFKWVPEIPAQSVPPLTNRCFGALVIHDKWKLAGQVGSMSAQKNRSDRTKVLVSQPGGSYVELICSGEELSNMDSTNSESSSKPCCGSSVSYHALGSPRARNPNVSTEIISSILSRTRSSEGEEADKMSFSAICTLDGTLTLIDGDKIIWSLCVDHQLFAITKLDVTGDGMEEVIACSWDGQTYIVNLSNEIMRFHFNENVAAFCSGTVMMEKDRPSSVLCYATLSGKLVVFYNVHLKDVGITNMVDVVKTNPHLTRHLKDLDVDTENKEDLRRFIREAMYGPVGEDM